MRPRLIAGSAAAGWIRLVDQLRERALEALEIKVKVEDLVDADGLRGRHRLLGRFGRRIFDFLHRAARDCEHDDESHLALRTRHLEAKTLVLVAQYLDVAALQAAPADRAVVKARPIADELDYAHRSDPYYAPRLRGDDLAMALDAGASRPSDNRRMHRPRGQDHAVSGLQLEAAALAFEHEGDRSIDAVKYLLVAVAVSRVAVARAVRPRVAAGGLGFELCHQLVECRHIAILRLLG